MALRRRDNKGDSPPRMAAKFVAALRRRQQSRGALTRGICSTWLSSIEITEGIRRRVWRQSLWRLSDDDSSQEVSTGRRHSGNRLCIVSIYFTLTVGYEPRYILKIWLLTLEEGVRKRSRENQWSQPSLPVFPDILWQSGYCSCDLTGSMERSYKRRTTTPYCPKFLISKLHVTVSR
ncbi:hypothetical protein HanRHA438_Chr08g0328471 [Helianthus annuus]|nr:hypothetical protein HanRHA438_Chr08g0328471 [Helianthus annuus]KAJ0899932.1 hypothetical protein HanPSC8_Chr08g0307761 [Helianthus annuus]